MNKRKLLNLLFLVYAVLLFVSAYFYAFPNFVGAHINSLNPFENWINSIRTELISFPDNLVYFLLYMVLMSYLFYAAVYFVLRIRFIVFILLPVINLILFFVLISLMMLGLKEVLFKSELFFYFIIVLSYTAASFTIFEFLTPEEKIAEE